MGSHLLLRKRLINQINSSADNVIYLYAPTGYGKTVLARQWAETQLESVIWFDGFATTRTSEIFKEIVKEIRKSIPTLNQPLANFDNISEIDEETLTRFLTVIEKDKSKFHIVIDNAEVIRRDHNEFARFLVSRLPSHVRLLLLTETSPRTSFLQEYGPSRFTIISPAHLQFTQEESMNLAQQFNVDLSKSNVSVLQDLTQGWPLGVHIAISQLEVTRDFKGLIHSIQNKGQDQFTIPAQRILASLTPEQLCLLMQLSFLEVIDAHAALELSENVDAIRILTFLSQDSMVVSQTKFNAPEFVIHPLLRKALISDFQRLKDFSVRVERIVSYLLDKGQVRELTTILLQLGSVDKLLSIIQDENVAQHIYRSIQEAIGVSRIDYLDNWIEVAKYMPIIGEIATGILSFYKGLLNGNLIDTESSLERIKITVADFPRLEAVKWNRDILALESTLYFAQGKLDDCFDKAIQCSEIPAQTIFHSDRHSVSYLQLALWGAVIQDDDSKIKKILKVLQLKNIDKASMHQNAVIHAMHALIAAQEGRFIEAKNELAVPLSSLGSSYSGFFAPYGAYLAEIMIVAESGDHQKGLALLQSAFEQALGARNFPIATTLLGRVAYQQILLGNTDDALASINQSRELIINNSLSDELHLAIDVWEARVRYWLMDEKRADELIARSQTSYLMRAFKAGILINQGNIAKALEITETFDLQIPRQRLTYHLYRAHCFAESPSAQLNEVRQAVEIGSKHGYFKHFLTQRSDVIQQYISLVAESPTPFNERLARAAGIRLNEMMVGNQNAGESLTRREADILRHLGTGLAISQIATNLCISKNTMKTHLKNIYRKLGATGRADAVEKGKKLLKV